MKSASPDFLPTQWSLVSQSRDPLRHRSAADKICQAYWYPIYATLRRTGYSEHDAEDQTQSFFLHMMDRSTFSKADPALGRFRTFILSCLGNFLHNARTYDRAQKRDSRKLVYFDSMEAEERYAAEPVDDLTPDRVFERTLAQEFLRQAEAELAAEYTHDGRRDVFESLWPHLFSDDHDHSRASLALQLDMKLETLKSNLHRMKKRFQQILRARAEQIVRNPDDGVDELRALQDAL